MSQLVHINSLAFGGSGVGRLDDGRTAFVTGTAPGDTVEIAIDKEKKTFVTAHMTRLVEAGEARIQPACPYAGQCGGCDWQHIRYADQLRAKRENVVAQLSHIALPHMISGNTKTAKETANELIGDIVASPHQQGYRNKIELATDKDARGRLLLGMHSPSSHTVVPIARCMLAQSPADQAPKALQGALRYIQGSRDLHILRVGVRTSTRTHETEIAIWTRPGSFPRAEAVRVLKNALHATSMVRVIADPGRARMIRGVEALWGRGHWDEKLCGHTYSVSAPSFFQVNTAQAETLIKLVLEALDVKNDDVVADLYCGAGTFTLPLSDRAGNVFAVEREGSSVRDLRRNIKNGCIDNIEVIGGDSARELPQMGALDGLVVDPPRAGLAKGMAESIAEAHPRKFVYVSCDAGTWARDVARLYNNGYKLIHATPVDLFPQTFHCEVVSLFEPVK